MKTPYERSTKFSNSQLSKLRTSIGGLGPGDQVVLVCGSYARREASPQSDIDFFVISDENGTNVDEKLRQSIQETVEKMPAKDGAFGNVMKRSDLLVNIGGEDDSNKNITCRILFLLEADWLWNESGFHDFRRAILGRYIRDTMTDHQLALFLLNDIVRFYRTVAVDYEFKISSAVQKPWAVRNIKLVFSRKLLYASGVFSIAMTADRRWDEKIRILEGLFNMPVLERLAYICGRSQTEGVLNSYNMFLGRMEDEDFRAHLDGLNRGKTVDEQFRALKNEGHNFTRELLKLFENTFESTHPIRRAVVF